MNASRVDHPRTSPVALRTNTARSTASPPDATVAMLDSSSSSPTGQDEVLHFLLLAVEVDHDPEQLTLFVRAPRVDAQRLAEPVRAARLVDVAVQGERRLVALDHAAHGGRADGHGRPAGVLEAHVRRQLRRIVEPGVVRRAVQAEDRALGL